MIALVNMPFGSLVRPPLALGLISAQLRQAGHEVQTFHFNLDFARMLGFSAYEVIALFKGVETQVGEWLFSQAAWRGSFGPANDELLRLCGEEIGTIPHIPDPISWLRKVRQRAIWPFLEQCLAQLFSDKTPCVVGFSCMFFQTLAALSLARLIRERHPHVKLIFGGACFHGEMGRELISKVPWIDAAATGEADDVIVPVFSALSEGRIPLGLRGIVYRDNRGQVKSGPPSVPMETSILESLPDPDFEEFFATAERVGLLSERSWQDRCTIPFESSRGCFWGQKSHCVFCGLNGEGMAFRSCSAEKVESSLRRLAARYPVRRLFATDNILPMNYFHTLLPRLAEAPFLNNKGEVKLFFEVKANLSRAQVQLLAAAGVADLQPGIESLSTPLLKTLGKGVTALQNVFLLKCCTEYGLVPYWNLLIGVPGEQASDYSHMQQWLPLLFHLRPPSGGAVRVECHRFSPYHRQPNPFVQQLQPARFYQGLFPSPPFELHRIAYYFDAKWKETLGDSAYTEVIRLVEVWLRRWHQDEETPRLAMADRPDGGLFIEDTRTHSLVVHELDPVQTKLYRLIADPVLVDRFIAKATQLCDLSESALKAQLVWFVDQGLALFENERVLGLAVSATNQTVSRDLRRVQMRRMASQLAVMEHASRTDLAVVDLQGLRDTTTGEA